MSQLEARSQTILDLKSQMDTIKEDLIPPNLDYSSLVMKEESEFRLLSFF